MNERFYIRFRNRNATWPVRSVTDEGVLLEEPDPCARFALLDFQPRGAVAEARVESIRRNFGWHPWQFKLDAFAENGLLGFRGVRPEALPAGYYKVRLELEGLRCATADGRFELTANGTATVDVRLEPDPRRVVVKLARCDPKVARVLDIPSCIDNHSAREWLGTDCRETRKACLLNILASLRAVPTPSNPLIDDLDRIVAVLDDRIYVAAKPSMYDRVQAMALDEANKKFWSEGEPTSSSHRRLLDAIPAADRQVAYTLDSYRAEGPAGIQIVFAVPPAGTPPHYYADIDIDLGNPLQDVAGFAIHMGELGDSRPTDHLDLFAKLSKKATRDFLYYSVANA